MDGDSTYSGQDQKDSLFSEFFAEYLTDAAKNEHLVDANTNSISSLDKNQKKNFSEEKMFDVLFQSNLAEVVAKEMDNEDNAKSLEDISFVYTTNIIKIDTVSVKITSPINKKSEYKGYSRNLLEKNFLFGIKDDTNVGFVDNGSSSWKNE
ncbi:MAG: hypothetical protein KAS62_03665, partial [Candidatus Delongbacteria bacterium]|nr:hypothetical protein [Candidatus Delongbacteria bacterium]